MSWAKLDDAFADHPKVVGLSDAAFRLHVTAILYAARYETDGEIPGGALDRMGGSPGCAAELADAGLWDITPGGYAIHDYLKYNPSREQRDELRRRAADRQERWRNERTNSVSNGVSNAVTNRTPVPDPLPSIREAKASLVEPAEPAKKRITEAFRAEMRVEFPDLDEAAEFDRATNHVAYRKAIDKRRYYRNWLVNARNFRRNHETNGQQHRGRAQPQLAIAVAPDGPTRAPDLVG